MIKPNHVAIIMDGNGRWAQSQGYPRFFGHVRGCKVVSEIVETAAEMGLKSLTLYAFSTENWKRPESEIKILFKLFKKFLKREEAKMIRNGIRLKFIGDLKSLDPEIQDLAYAVKERTKHCSKMDLILAINYGSKSEIVRSFNLLKAKENISEKDIEATLWNPEIPQIDLLIRTGGEQRVSNFLLWQLAYAELFFEEKFWPDFTIKDFHQIIDKFSVRERRYGDIISHEILESGFAQ